MEETIKVFVADKRPKGYVSPDDYHWCADGELLVFGIFQTEENRKGNEVCMFGVTSLKGTTHILVKEVGWSMEFYTELVKGSLKAMGAQVDGDGNFFFDLGEGWVADANAPGKLGEICYNVDELAQELIDKASVFKDGDRVYCRGRVLSLREMERS